MPRNKRSGSEPGDEMATVLPLRSAGVLISALASTTCGTPGQVQPTILTPVPRTPATIDSAEPMSTLSISPEISAFISVAPALIWTISIFRPCLAAKPPLSTMAMIAGIALGFENAVLPDFVLRVRGGKRRRRATAAASGDFLVAACLFLPFDRL